MPGSGAAPGQRRVVRPAPAMCVLAPAMACGPGLLTALPRWRRGRCLSAAGAPGSLLAAAPPRPPFPQPLAQFLELRTCCLQFQPQHRCWAMNFELAVVAVAAVGELDMLHDVSHQFLIHVVPSTGRSFLPLATKRVRTPPPVHRMLQRRQRRPAPPRCVDTRRSCVV